MIKYLIYPYIRRYSKRYQELAKNNLTTICILPWQEVHKKEGQDVVAMEMTKWFDTNYHYIVPEFTKDQEFKFSEK
jgi:5-methyltetrahydropteroyltriglutamate--homocysteine methyltransferase